MTWSNSRSGCEDPAQGRLSETSFREFKSHRATPGRLVAKKSTEVYTKVNINGSWRRSCWWDCLMKCCRNLVASPSFSSLKARDADMTELHQAGTLSSFLKPLLASLGHLLTSDDPLT